MKGQIRTAVIGVGILILLTASFASAVYMSNPNLNPPTARVVSQPGPLFQGLLIFVISTIVFLAIFTFAYRYSKTFKNK